MVKPANGFMSDDGNFFEQEKDAEFHEAETALLSLFGQRITNAPLVDLVMETLGEFSSQIRRYIDAYEAINKEGAAKVVTLDGYSVSSTELERLLQPVDVATNNGRGEEKPSSV